MLSNSFVRGYHHRSLTNFETYYDVNIISHHKLKGVEIFLYLYGEADGMQATNKEIISAPVIDTENSLIKSGNCFEYCHIICYNMQST